MGKKQKSINISVDGFGEGSISYKRRLYNFMAGPFFFYNLSFAESF
jgi:hypothetical protein